MANKKTVSMTMDEYRAFMTAVTEGFSYQDAEGKPHKFRPNAQLAMILQTEAVSGMRISDVLNLRLDSIVKDGKQYKFNVTEQKTGKARNFTVSKELYNTLREYALNNGIRRTDNLFTIGERAVQKQIGIVADHLGLANISTHSFRKCFAKNAYEVSGYNIELVRELLQHASTTTTQRYIAMSQRDIEKALQNASDTFLIA